jgi:hypothetical protein
VNQALQWHLRLPLPLWVLSCLIIAAATAVSIAAAKRNASEVRAAEVSEGSGGDC